MIPALPFLPPWRLLPQRLLYTLRAGWLAAAAISGFCAEPVAIDAGQASQPDAAASAAEPRAASAVLTREQVLAGSQSQRQPFRLAEAAHALVFEMGDLREQALTFARIVAFVEKSGASRSRILGDAEFTQWLARSGQRPELLTLGNDLGADELARFYNTASIQREPLSARELALLDELKRHRLLRSGKNGWEAPDPRAIVLSFPAVSVVEGCAECAVSEQARRAIFEHEYGHALYAGDAFLQHYTAWFWANRTSLGLRSHVQRFLAARGYDTTLPALVLKEFHAFLRHSEDPALFKPAEWGLNEQEFAALREQFGSALQ